jgi:hypothetical protein
MGRHKDILALAFALLLVPLTAFNSIDTSGEEALPRSGEGLPISDLQFYNERIYQESDLVYRSAAGDLIPEREGNELATCSRNGKVVVTYGSRLTWHSQVVHTSTIQGTSGERAQVYSMDAGDVVPEHDGEELIAVDEDFSVNLISYTEGEGWNTQIIWRGFDWLYEVDIGELTGTTDQKEIVVVGEFKRATILERSGQGWEATTIARDSEIIEACWISDVIRERPGNEVLLGGGRGTIMVCYQDLGTWKVEDLVGFGDRNQISDLLMADIDPNIPGEEIYASTFDGNVRQVFRSGGNWTQRIVHKEGRIIYGMETGEIAGQNVLTIGTYAYRTGIIWYEEGFNFKPLYSEEYLVMGTGIFDIDPAYEGAEILSLSYLGRVVMIYRDTPGAEVILPFRRTAIAPGETARIPFIVEARGGYDGEVMLSLENLENDTFEVNLERSTVNADSLTYLDITSEAPESIAGKKFTVVASTPYGTSREDLTVEVVEVPGDFKLDPVIISNELGADRQINVGITVTSGKGLLNDLIFTYDHVPTGVSVSFQRPRMEIDQGSDDQRITLSSQGWVSPGSYHFFLIGAEDSTYTRAVGVKLDIMARTVAEFRLALEPLRITVPRFSNATVTLNMISIGGFTGNATVNVVTSHEEVDIRLPADIIPIPSTQTVEIDIEDLQEDIVIGIRGKVGGLEREGYVLLEVEPPEKDLIVQGPNTTVILEMQGSDIVSGEFRIYLEPINGEIQDISISIKDLPMNFSINILPQDIERIFYPLNVTFILEGPLNEVPTYLRINFSSLGVGSWEIDVPLSIDEDHENEEESGSFPWWLVVLLLLIAGGALVIFLYLRGQESNDLNEEEKVRVEHEGRTLHSPSSTTERPHGRLGGSSRPFHRQRDDRRD